jgi:hypothetical protein
MADSNDNTPSKPPASEDTLEKAFELLHKGKEAHSKGDSWNAADKFVQAREILKTLAEVQPKTTEDEQQIAQLYESKTKEYLHTSRQCLIEAMKQEKDQDEKEDATPFFSSLTDEQAEQRIRIFHSLFSKRLENTAPGEGAVDQQWNIEERLMELNASLPKGFKTSDERMSDINRGLNRLGLSLYTQKEPFARLQEHVPKDEEDQVADIIAQAHDEVATERNFSSDALPAKGPAVKDDDDDDDDDDDVDDEEDEYEEGDLKLDDDQLAIKQIRKKVVKAQVKLAELVVLLDEAKAMKKREDEENDLHGDESEEEASEKGADEVLRSGKKKLKSARKDLEKALTEWTENLL